MMTLHMRSSMVMASTKRLIGLFTYKQEDFCLAYCKMQGMVCLLSPHA